MGIFGWNYPPGCDGVPDDDIDPFCPNCGKEHEDDAELVDDWYCSEQCKATYEEFLKSERQAEIEGIEQEIEMDRDASAYFELKD